MNIYYQAFKTYPHNTNKKYGIYIRFNKRVCPVELSKSLNRKFGDRTNFGSDKNNSLSIYFEFKNRCKNFMLEMKKMLLKDEDIREVSIREIK